MKRIFVTVLVATTLWSTPAQAETPPPAPEPLTVDGTPVDPNDPALPEYWWQIANGAPGVEYWSKVAHCETRGDWQDHGRFGGGLGIMNSKRFSQRASGTWERWGGEQFALRPQQATPLQQIVVANRIAMFGWRVTYRDWNGYHERVVQKTQYKKPAGFNGWGCIKQNRKGPRKRDRWLNPAKFERARHKYWTNNPVPYMTHELVLPKMNIPRWAWTKYPNQPKRFQ